MKKGDPANLILRWQLARIYEDERFTGEADRTVHVAVHRAAMPSSEPIEAPKLLALRLEAEEQLNRWDRENVVEGWVRESTLVEALVERNAGEIDQIQVEPDQRRLAEDMVLVQALGDEAAWQAALAVYAGGEADFPSLEPLAGAEASLWLDVTQPARRAARTRYRQALREARPKGKGGQHAKQR